MPARARMGEVPGGCFLGCTRGMESIVHYLSCPVVGAAAWVEHRWRYRAWPVTAELRQALLLDCACIHDQELAVVSAWHDANVTFTGRVRRRGQEAVRLPDGVKALRAHAHSRPQPMRVHCTPHHRGGRAKPTPIGVAQPGGSLKLGHGRLAVVVGYVVAS